MEAVHPKTGGKIKIMKTETHLYKNNKTLIWLHSPPQTYQSPHRYSRWYTLVTSTHLAEQWYPVLNTYPSAIILETPTDANKQWLQHKAPKQGTILFLSKVLMAQYGKEKFSKEGFTNVVCLEELGAMFPHILRTYVQGDPLPLTALMVSAVFRVQTFHGLTQQDIDHKDLQPYLTMLQTTYGLKASNTPDAQPEALWLIQQYFVPTKARRAKEINYALQQNLLNPSIDTILLLNEADYLSKLPQHPKLQQIVLGRRLTYADVILTIQDKVPPNTFVAFSNSDIYLDPISWLDLWSLNLKDTFLSLLRYEEAPNPAEEAQLYGPRPDSQDTWVVLSTSVQSRKDTWNFDALNFPFGKAGCDNAINVEMLRKKFVVANPALSLKTVHCHKSQIRSYSQDDVVDKPFFLYLDPTGLHDLQPTTNLQDAQTLRGSASSAPVKRHIHAHDPKHVRTFCAMVNRKDIPGLTFEPDSPNLYEAQASKEERIYTFANSFVTPNGLVYGYDKLILGKTQQVREAWTTTTISHMTPSIGVEHILATPLDDTTASSIWTYMTGYLAKILRMRASGLKGDMWMPRDLPRLQEFLQHFQWEESVLPVLPRDSDIVGFGRHVQWLEPTATANLPTQDDMEALRESLKGYTTAIEFPRRLVIFQDDIMINADTALLLETALEEAGFEVNIVYPGRSSPNFILQRTFGSAFAITSPATRDLYWLLPKGARVLDLMQETEIQGQSAHMAGLCGLQYWIALLPRSKQALTEQVMRSVLAMACFGQDQSHEPSTAEKPQPLITMPVGFKEFHGHKGDSFREMVAMWRDRGWVRMETTTKSPFVWWGHEGDNLLYDRATWDWIAEYQMELDKPVQCKTILAGNPDAKLCPLASTSAIAKQWTFWPRHPRVLEARVQEGLPTFSDRKKSLVFYGKIENEIQEEHRTNALHEACDEFEMPSGPDATYRFTQDEYLDRLASAKFGLCLAGFGPKCNREIECMALGTVPVVAPDVDMDNYVNPPEPGKHYLRLASFNPENARAVIQAVTEEQWTAMSTAAHQWWKENASCEGIFNITKSLLNM